MPGNIDIDMKPSAPSGVEELVAGSVAAYPNPAGGESLAVTFDWRAGFSVLTLTNAAGVTVYSTAISVLDGANTAVLPTVPCSGAYMIRVGKCRNTGGNRPVTLLAHSTSGTMQKPVQRAISAPGFLYHGRTLRG